MTQKTKKHIKKLILSFFLVSFQFLLLSQFAALKSQNREPKNTTLVKPPFGHVPLTKVTKTHLFMYMGNKVKFDNPQGMAVTRLKSWDDTTKTSDDAIVTVYGINSGQNLILYNTSLFTVGVYGLEEEGEGKLNNPRGIAADEYGNVYVADTGGKRIVHLFNPGKNLQYVREIGKEYLQEPRQVALDAESTIYVTDAARNEVVKFSPSGEYISSFNNDNSLIAPDGIVVFDTREKWCGYNEDFFIIIDKNNTRIRKFSREWEQVKQIEGADFGFRVCRLAYGAGDYLGNSYITDVINHTIHKFDKNLNYITSFGEEGTGNGEFIEPRGICIWKRYGQVIIVEKEGGQYFWIGTDVKKLSASVDPEKQNLSVSYFLTETSMVKLKLKDLKTDKIIDITERAQRKKIGKNENKIRLDGLHNRINKELFNHKEYELIIEASATYSSRNYFSKTKSVKVFFENDQLKI